MWVNDRGRVHTIVFLARVTNRIPLLSASFLIIVPPLQVAILRSFPRRSSLGTQFLLVNLGSFFRAQTGISNCDSFENSAICFRYCYVSETPAADSWHGFDARRIRERCGHDHRPDDWNRAVWLHAGGPDD